MGYLWKAMISVSRMQYLIPLFKTGNRNGRDSCQCHNWRGHNFTGKLATPQTDGIISLIHGTDRISAPNLMRTRRKVRRLTLDAFYKQTEQISILWLNV